MARRVDLHADPSELASRATIRASAVTALMTLVRYWTSADFLTSLTVRAGITVESRDVPALFLLGLNGPMRPSSLARDLQVSAGNVSKIADRLVNGGLAARVAAETDARASFIVLTDGGVTASTALLDEGNRLLEELLRDESQSSVEGFSRVLLHLADRVSRDATE